MLRIIFTALIACAFTSAASAQDATTAQQPRTITVTGTANVYVKPDEAILMVGASDESRDLNDAKSNVDSAGKAIVAAVRAAGVQDKDIQTDNLQIYIRNEESSLKAASRTRYFVVSRSYRITLRDAEKVQKVYDAVVAAGANSIQGPSYQTSELRKYRDQARAMALQAAREKAAAMAKELGIAIGDVRTIREGVERHYFPMAANAFVSAQAQMQAAQVGAVDDTEGSTPLGQVTVSADVEIVFDLVK